MNQEEDVEVVLGHDCRYKFHSGTLARNSTLLADLLTESNAAKLSLRAKNLGAKTRWMIELSQMPDVEFPAGQLTLVELTQNGERADGRKGIVVNENGRVPQADRVFGLYEKVFYSFYNKEVSIDDADMSTALSDCYKLLEICDYLGCTSLISKPIEVALLQHGQDFFRGIQTVPHLWIVIAYQIRSEMIFKECMVHLVGNWKTLRNTKKAIESLREINGLRGLIEKYHRMLLNQSKALELAIMSFYPEIMRLPTDETPIKREAYARDVLLWMALSFFRQWVGQRLVTEKGRHGVDGGYELYKLFAAAGDSYLDRSIITQFHAKFPMTRKALTVVDRHIGELKICIKDIVEQHQILKSFCHLDLHQFPVNYLTCVDFQRSDFPWISGQAELSFAPEKPEFKPGGNDLARQNLDMERKLQERSLMARDVEMAEDDEEKEEDSMEEGPPTKRVRTTDE